MSDQSEQRAEAAVTDEAEAADAPSYQPRNVEIHETEGGETVAVRGPEDRNDPAVAADE